MTPGAAENDSASDLHRALDALWEERSSEILVDVRSLVTEIAGLRHDSGVGDPERVSARRNSHRLVGVLGVFGLHEAAGRIARVERLLASDTSLDAGSLTEASRLVREILRTIDGGGQPPRR